MLVRGTLPRGTHGAGKWWRVCPAGPHPEGGRAAGGSPLSAPPPLQTAEPASSGRAVPCAATAGVGPTATPSAAGVTAWTATQGPHAARVSQAPGGPSPPPHTVLTGPGGLAGSHGFRWAKCNLAVPGPGSRAWHAGSPCQPQLWARAGSSHTGPGLGGAPALPVWCSGRNIGCGGTWWSCEVLHRGPASLGQPCHLRVGVLPA